MNVGRVARTLAPVRPVRVRDDCINALEHLPDQDNPLLIDLVERIHALMESRP